MSLRELFSKNPNIIVNTDIDGVLSGLLLVKYLNCNIVGFTNSKDKVWLADGYDDLYKHIYIDMFVTDNKAVCIDQHVVAVDEAHQKKIRNTKTKISPQLDNDKFFRKDKFETKYPFGTIQYLISILESEGIKVSLPDLNISIPKSSIKLGDIILRADDAMRSSLYKYKNNADYWWNWLFKQSDSAHSIQVLIDYLDSIRTQIEPDETKHNSEECLNKLKEYVEGIKIGNIKKKGIKDLTKEYFKNNFHCKSRSGDGGFDQIVNKKGNITDDFKKYLLTINSLLGFPQIAVPSHYHVHVGKYWRIRWRNLFKKSFKKDYTINGEKVFSYAFIYGPNNNRYPNFSFTTNMK